MLDKDINKLVEQQKMVGSSIEEIQKNCEIAQVAITEDMKKILGSKLDVDGLSSAVKSYGSLKRKIDTEWNKLDDNGKKSMTMIFLSLLKQL